MQIKFIPSEKISNQNSWVPAPGVDLAAAGKVAGVPPSIPGLGTLFLLFLVSAVADAAPIGALNHPWWNKMTKFKHIYIFNSIASLTFTVSVL